MASMDRVERDSWANFGSLCARLFVLAGPMLERAPTIQRDVEDALLAMLSRRSELYDPLARRLEAFEIEDDGTPEWGYTVDLIDNLLHALEGLDGASCLASGLRSYLDTTFNEVALRLAEAAGNEIVSQAEAERLVPTDPSWRRANELARALSP
jgi:hypothetical protein